MASSGVRSSHLASSRLAPDSTPEKGSTFSREVPDRPRGLTLEEATRACGLGAEGHRRQPEPHSQGGWWLFTD